MWEVGLGTLRGGRRRLLRINVIDHYTVYKCVKIAKNKK